MAARIDGAHRRLSNEQDGRAWHAWHVAALTRVEKMPALETMFTKQKAQVEQSGEEQTIMLDHLFLAWGGDPAQLADVRADRVGENS